MFKVKIEGNKNVIKFLESPTIVGLNVTITYDFGFGKSTGVIIKNEKNWITIQVPCDTFTIVKDAILTLELNKSDYNFIKNFTIKSNNKLELGDIVEIVNIDGLNRVLYDGYPKGFNKKLIGLQGMIAMIDNTTHKNITYYIVDLPIKNPRIHDMRYIIDGRTIFLKDNLKLVNKENDVKVNNKQEYIKELEDIKNQQKELADKMALLQKQIEEEDNKKEWWTPKVQDVYYWISGEAIVEKLINHEYNSDKRIINNLNYYKTKEEAERQAFEQLLQRKLNKFAFENNEYDICYKDGKEKWFIYYDYDDNELKTTFTIIYNYIGETHFTSKEIAEKAIEEFKDDLIRYFTSDR